MSVTSSRSIVIEHTGDVEFSQEFPAVTSTTGSGQNQLVNLSSGNNTITPPSGAVAVTIIPPAGNVATIALKSTTADVGFGLKPTDPSSIALASTTAFYINAGSVITGLRLIYS